MDPFDREQILANLDFRGNSCARSAIDLALHDLLGKALGVPVYKLIGGKCRDRVLVALEIGGGPAAEMGRRCADFVQQGVRAFKPKIGGYPEEDAIRLKAIREAVGPGIAHPGGRQPGIHAEGGDPPLPARGQVRRGPGAARAARGVPRT